MIKDALAFLFRVVKADVVDHKAIRCNSKAGQDTEYAVCNRYVGSAAMCGVVLCSVACCTRACVDVEPCFVCSLWNDANGHARWWIN